MSYVPVRAVSRSAVVTANDLSVGAREINASCDMPNRTTDLAQEKRIGWGPAAVHSSGCTLSDNTVLPSLLERGMLSMQTKSGDMNLTRVIQLYMY